MWEMIALLVGPTFVCTIYLGELGEGALSPNDEPAKIPTWSNLEQIEAVHGCGLHARNVTHGTHDAGIFAIHKQRTTTHGITSIAHFALSRTNLLRVADFVQFLLATQLL